MRYLLDTCTISYFFRKDQFVIDHMREQIPSDLAISAITAHEIEYGLALNPAREKTLRPVWEDLLKQINILNFDIEVAQFAANIRAYLKQNGNLIGSYDMLIAATALAHELICVTSNEKEFKRIPNLQLKDWRLAPVDIPD